MELHRKQRVLGRLPLAAVVVTFAGLFAAGVLSAGHLLNLPVPCGASRGCVTVAAHPASRVLGVPIAYLGFAAFAAILLLIPRAAAGRRARVGLVLLTGLGAIASAALLVLSHQVIRATCPWCVASGVAMTLLFALALALLRVRSPVCAVSPCAIWALGYLTAAALGVQAGFMERAASRPPIPAARLAGLTEAEIADPAKSLGSPNAPVTVVLFADMWCFTCRTACDALIRYQRAHPEGVRLIYRHRPIWEIRGHEYSGTAAALSEIAAERGKFWSFLHAMHGQWSPLDAAGYLQLMVRLGFDPAEVEARMSRPEDPAIARARRDKELAERLGVHATPAYIVIAGSRPPVSASPRTLPRILNSPEVQSLLAQAAQSRQTRARRP